MKQKTLLLWIVVVGAIISCSGCGETVRGMGKDAHRVGKGVRTIFISEE